MKKKFFGLVLACILCLSLLTGCQLGSRTSSVPEEEGPVTVYAVDYETMGARNQTLWDQAVPQNFLKQYNSSVNKEQQVDIQYFPDVATMNQQLTTELLSEGGPDLFVFQETDLPNFLNFARQGVFVDLDPYLEKSGYSKDQFKEIVFDYGIVNGKRSFIPLEYGIPLCITTQSLAEEYGLDKIGEQLNFQNYYELLSGIKDIKPGVHWFSELDSFLYRLIPAFIQSEENRGLFQSTTFKKSIEEYNEMLISQGGENSLVVRWEYEYMDILVNRELLFLNSPKMSDRILSSIVGQYWAGEEGKDNPLLLYPTKEYNGIDYCAYVGKMMAINHNSDRKNKAWEVIDHSLYPGFQSTMVGGYNPVNLEAQNRNRKDWENEGSAFGKTERKEFIKKYYEIVDSITKCDCLTYNPMYMQDVFGPLYQEYQDGKSTIDEFAKELQNKTGIYLREQN